MKKIKFSTSQKLIYSYENHPFNPVRFSWIP